MAQIIKERESPKFIITKKISYHNGNVKINNRKHKKDYQYSISLKLHIIVDIRGICRRSYLSTQNGIIFYAKRNSARKMAFDMPTNIAPTCWPYDGPTSKLTLGQRSLSTLGQRSGKPKYSVGPTLSCYLGCSLLKMIKNNKQCLLDTPAQ